MIFRKAEVTDIDRIAKIYERIIEEEEAGRCTTGWLRGVYPVKATAQAALERDDLFVEEDQGEIVGAAVINQMQVDCYVDGNWEFPAEDSEVMVLHTLVIDPQKKKCGYGRAFVGFYERYALEHGCRYLRMDTNARNTTARRLYESLGYKIIGQVPCVFNGIPGVQLMLIEKKLGKE